MTPPDRFVEAPHFPVQSELVTEKGPGGPWRHQLRLPAAAREPSDPKTSLRICSSIAQASWGIRRSELEK